MKTLYLLRHAKSSWDNTDIDDFDRPLNDRGRSAAPFMGDLIARKGYSPEIILCSPAARARQTAELVSKHAGLSPKSRFDDRIYEASPQALRQVASEIDDSYSSALIVGHNPGMEGLVRYLTGNIESMPTAALAVISLQISSWKAISDGSGSLRALYRPKEEARREEK